MILKILIVEDEKDLLWFNEQLFDAYPRVKILKASTGEEAIGIIHKEKPHVIILDLKLSDYPLMDGMEVLEKLRKFDNNTEVIITTALKDESFVMGAKKLGARAYFKKPFSIQLLKDEIENILKEKGVA